MKNLLFFLSLCGIGHASITPYDSLLNLAQNHELGRAEKLARELLQSNPLDARVLLMMAKLQTNGDSSKHYLEKTLQKGTKELSGENLFLLAQYHYAQGNWKEACKNYEKLVRNHPKSLYIYPSMYWWGNGLLALGDPASLDSAEHVFLNLLQEQRIQDYHYTLALEGVAKSRLKRKLPTKAKDALTMAMESSPQEKTPHLLLLATLTSKQTRDSVGYNFYRDKLKNQYSESMESLFIEQKSKSGNLPTTSKTPGINTISPSQIKPLNPPSAQKSPEPENPLIQGKPNVVVEKSVIQNKPTVPIEKPVIPEKQVTPIEKPAIPESHKTEVNKELTPNAKIFPFYLQLGAFSVEANAQLRMTQLQDFPVKISIDKRDRQGTTVYVLVSQGFPSREEAQQFAEAQFKPKGIPYYILQKN